MRHLLGLAFLHFCCRPWRGPFAVRLPFTPYPIPPAPPRRPPPNTCQVITMVSNDVRRFDDFALFSQYYLAGPGGCSQMHPRAWLALALALQWGKKLRWLAGCSYKIWGGIAPVARHHACTNAHACTCCGSAQWMRAAMSKQPTATLTNPCPLRSARCCCSRTCHRVCAGGPSPGLPALPGGYFRAAGAHPGTGER